MTLMTAAEVAAYLKVSRSLVYQMIQRDELPAIKVGRLPRVRSCDLDRWIADRAEGLPAPGEDGRP